MVISHYIDALSLYHVLANSKLICSAQIIIHLIITHIVKLHSSIYFLIINHYLFYCNCTQLISTAIIGLTTSQTFFGPSSRIYQLPFQFNKVNSFISTNSQVHSVNSLQIQFIQNSVYPRSRSVTRVGSTRSFFNLSSTHHV